MFIVRLMKQRCGNLTGKENGFELRTFKIFLIFKNLKGELLDGVAFLHYLQKVLVKLLYIAKESCLINHISIKINGRNFNKKPDSGKVF